MLRACARACFARSAKIRAPVSVLVPTLDEEVNLPDCLRSLAWVDEIFVVDSFSRDRTVEIAREHGAQVVQHEFQSPVPYLMVI